MVNIVHASISENGTAHNAKPGDQTGKEVCIRSWYNKPWDMIIRHPNEDIREKAANISVLLANSELVGYDQDNRNTLYKELEKNNFSASSYINGKVLTETDCSAFVCACYVCAGVGTLKYSSNAPTTRTMEQIYKAAGFQILKDKQYTTSDEYLLKGDILLKVGSHTVMAIDSGSRARQGANIDYFPQYKGTSDSIVTALGSMGIDYSKSYRKKIAEANGISNYSGTYLQNIKLINLLKSGYLVMPAE